MEAEQLIAYLSNPGQLTGEATADLESLVDRYPYFGIGQSPPVLRYCADCFGIILQPEK